MHILEVKKQKKIGPSGSADIPKQVLVPALPDDAAELEAWLREKRGTNVTIQIAQRGAKADLMKNENDHRKEKIKTDLTAVNDAYETKKKSVEEDRKEIEQKKRERERERLRPFRFLRRRLLFRRDLQ